MAVSFIGGGNRSTLVTGVIVVKVNHLVLGHPTQDIYQKGYFLLLKQNIKELW